jgi:hypothetical protein
LWFTETDQECRDDSSTSADAYLMSAVDEPMFQLELATRLVVFSKQDKVDDACWSLYRLLHSEKGASSCSSHLTAVE